MTKPIVIFDFDGTLVDSCPGIVHAANLFAERNGFDAISANDLKPVISLGSAKMLERITGLSLDAPNFKTLQQEFLDIYRRHGVEQNKLFAGIPELLAILKQQDIRWGIMTNGRSVMVNTMLGNFKLKDAPESVVCVDHISKRKPDPEGLLKVCQQMQCSPERCYYVGDAPHDIEAGRRANMQTVAAAYGYVPLNNPAENWSADYLISTPLDLLDILNIKVS